MGLRRRLDRLEGQATGTMSDARLLIAMARDLVAEMGDGVEITLIRKEGGPSLMDFVAGNADEFPFSVRVTINE